MHMTSEEQRRFLEHMNNLRDILGEDWDHVYADLYVLFFKLHGAGAATR